MATGYGTVKVKGLREVNRAFSELGAELKVTLRDSLKYAGEPVRAEAETLAASRIRNIGPVWARMKLGVRTRDVYVAPATRRRRGSPRPAFGVLLLTKALIPAALAKEREVADRLEKALERLAKRKGF